MTHTALHLTLAALAIAGLTATTPAQAPFPIPVPADSGYVAPVAPVAPPPLPVPQAPVMPVPLVVPVAPVAGAMTIRQFACADFHAGKHSVVVVHPCTGCPVKVCFCLPVCPRKVRVNCNTVEFRWGLLCCKRVAIRFMADGSVRVI